MYVIGGIDLMEDTYSDVWYIDITLLKKIISGEGGKTNFWNQLQTSGTPPGKISNHRAIAVDNKIFIYGGLINNDNERQSLYSLDITTGVWTKHPSKVFFIYNEYEKDITLWPRWAYHGKS